MKVCIPTFADRGMDETVYNHFGSAPYFTIVDTETSSVVEVIDNENQHHEHGSCNPIQYISGKGVEAVVTGGMGRRAVQVLNDGGVKVFQANGQTVSDVVAEFKNGNIQELSPDAACAGHRCQ